MPDEDRYQVGDQCYSGIEAAAQAYIARLSPTVVQRDLGMGGGVEPVQMTPRRFNSEDGSGAWLDYTFEGMNSYDTLTEVMRWHPAACVNDGASLARMSDAADLVPLFILALIVVWGGKQLLNIFAKDSNPS